MNIPQRTLLVWPNPFHALDHLGHPAGVLSYEPKGDGVNTFDSRRFVGARLESKILEKAIEGTAQQTLQRTWYVYDDEPTSVPESPYYLHAIARGEIFAADEETGKRAGIINGFVKPEVLLERAKEEAIEAYERNPPHEDLDGLAPDELYDFTFGPMKVATERRKKREEEAKKAEQAAKKAEEEVRALEEKGVADRKLAREKRQAERRTEQEKAAEAAKNEEAAKKVAEEAAARARAAEDKQRGTKGNS